MKKKIIKGYVLYKNEHSTGENYSRREGINYSANVATVYASLLKGVLVEESLEKRIKQSGLKETKKTHAMKSPESCFKRCKKTT